MILEEYLKMLMPCQSSISFYLLGAFVLRMSLECILLSMFFIFSYLHCLCGST